MLSSLRTHYKLISIIDSGDTRTLLCLPIILYNFISFVNRYIFYRKYFITSKYQYIFFTRILFYTPTINYKCNEGGFRGDYHTLSFTENTSSHDNWTYCQQHFGLPWTQFVSFQFVVFFFLWHRGAAGKVILLVLGRNLEFL